MDNVPPPPPPPVPPGQPFYPGQMPPPQRGWFGRNWLWFIPAGCLSVLLLGAVSIGALVFFVFGAMKSSDVYKTAVAAAKSNARVSEALGTPVEEGTFLSGSINLNGSSGNADFAIPISGPKGKATVYTTATKSDGTWTYSKLSVHVDKSGEDIDLNQPSP